MSGFGFGNEAKAALKPYKIEVDQCCLEWDDFERVSKEDAAKGLPLVFAFPTRVLLKLNPADIGFGGLDVHAGIAIHHPAGEYVSRQHGRPNPTITPMKGLYQFVRARIMPDYRIHCLRHRPE